MSDKTKLPILAILILLMVVSLLLAFAEYHLLQKEKVKTFALQQDLEGLKAREIQAENELEESKKKIADLLVQFQEAEDKLNSLNSALAEEKKAKADALTQVKQMVTYIEKQKDLKLSIESKLNDTEAKLESALRKLKDSEAKKTELEQKIKSLEVQIEEAQIQESQWEEKIELGTIQVAPDIKIATIPDSSVSTGGMASISEEVASGAARTGSKEGKVLVVNKDYNFIVMNLGSKDGVRVGDIFSIYRNNKNIGDVRVEKIHDSMAAADFLIKDMKDQVREGDVVVEKNK